MGTARTANHTSSFACIPAQAKVRNLPYRRLASQTPRSPVEFVECSLQLHCPMGWLSFIFGNAWRYRAEIVFAMQAVSKLRKSAAELTRDYLKAKVRERLAKQILAAIAQAGLILVAYGVNREQPSLYARLFASTILWTVTVYNLAHLIFYTIPEVAAISRALRGRVGFTLKYILGISLVTELLELDVVFLFVCLTLTVSSRTLVSRTFQYVRPWRQLSRELVWQADHPQAHLQRMKTRRFRH